MATVAPSPVHLAPEPTILLDEPWETYCQLRDIPANNHVRMSYLDGELTIMSPGYHHERPAVLLGQLVRAVAAASGRKLLGIATTTLRRGKARTKGAGKEADAAFYLGANERLIRERDDVDLSIDPPPDLAIEADDTNDSTRSLAIDARLGVPEVWRFRVADRSIHIHRLVNGAYRVSALPRLTPPLILQALDRYRAGDLDEVEWFDWARAWAADLPEA